MMRSSLAFTIAFVSIVTSGCVAGLGDYNDGMTALKDGHVVDARIAFSKACAQDNADACFEQAKLTKDGAEAVALLNKACDPKGSLAACHELGMRLAKSNSTNSKAAFTKACQTPHSIVQPYTPEEEQAEMARIQSEGGATAGAAGAAGLLSLLMTKGSPTDAKAKNDEQCRQYRVALELKRDSCKQAGIAKPELIQATRFDKKTGLVVAVPEGTACTVVAH